MRRKIKNKLVNLCSIVFMLCLSIRFLEYIVIKTDNTVIGENVLHKIAGIIILAIVLKKINLNWSDIGFKRNNFVSNLLKGLLLGSVCFTISYGLELAILAMQETPAHLEIYISSFSLTGSQVKNTGFVFLLICILFNIINVWMEEGIFRGLFIKHLSKTNPFMKANLISALLFGIWHIVMPIKSYMSGEMPFTTMVFMGIGYIILSSVMAIKWGMLYRMTGSIWAGLGDHLFNNTIATNMLHVVSVNGADELQIVRIMIAQLISFAFVLIIYYRKNKKTSKNSSINFSLMDITQIKK